MIEPVTHRIHWRAVCDAAIHGRGFDIHRTHSERIEQASGFYDCGLIPERCRFGPRRLCLEGEVDYRPPKHGRAEPSRYGHQLAEGVLWWVLNTMYGDPEQRLRHDVRPEPRNMVIEVRVSQRASEAA